MQHNHERLSLALLIIYKLNLWKKALDFLQFSDIIQDYIEYIMDESGNKIFLRLKVPQIIREKGEYIMNKLNLKTPKTYIYHKSGRQAEKNLKKAKGQIINLLPFTDTFSQYKCFIKEFWFCSILCDDQDEKLSKISNDKQNEQTQSKQNKRNVKNQTHQDLQEDQTIQRKKKYSINLENQKVGKEILDSNLVQCINDNLEEAVQNNQKFQTDIKQQQQNSQEVLISSNDPSKDPEGVLFCQMQDNNNPQI